LYCKAFKQNVPCSTHAGRAMTFLKHNPRPAGDEIATTSEAPLQRQLSSLAHWKSKMNAAHKELLDEFQKFARDSTSAQNLMERIAARIHEKMTRYNWAGFYLVDPADVGFLVVGPYAGSFTPNVRIPLTKGLCGLAATSGQTVVVQDVTTDTRYLAGSALVKSEIVVPIFANKKLAGELDIESYFPATFTTTERAFVEATAVLVGHSLETKR
jgi:L-methionine (R)-S-oxide reductase